MATINAGGISDLVQDSSPQLGGNLDTQSFTVDGRDVSTDGTKLDGIEASATADQSNAEIKTAYENNSNTNVFLDAEKTKLTGIEASATADQSDAEIKTAYENNSNTNAYTDSEKTKLSNIEASATADQTDAQIKTAYENNSNTNAFTDTLQTKLNGIASSSTANPNAIDNVVDDSSPQLGGNLDLNSNNITGTGGIPSANLTGTIVDARLPTSMSGKTLTTAAVTGTINANTLTALGDGSSADGKITLNCSQNSHGVKIQAPAHSCWTKLYFNFTNISRISKSSSC